MFDLWQKEIPKEKKCLETAEIDREGIRPEAFIFVFPTLREIISRERFK